MAVRWGTCSMNEERAGRCARQPASSLTPVDGRGFPHSKSIHPTFAQHAPTSTSPPSQECKSRGVGCAGPLRRSNKISRTQPYTASSRCLSGGLFVLQRRRAALAPFVEVSSEVTQSVRAFPLQEPTKRVGGEVAVHFRFGPHAQTSPLPKIFAAFASLPFPLARHDGVCSPTCAPSPHPPDCRRRRRRPPRWPPL